MYNNNIVNFQESTAILNACTKKKAGNLLNASRICEPCDMSDPAEFLFSILDDHVFMRGLTPKDGGMHVIKP